MEITEFFQSFLNVSVRQPQTKKHMNETELAELSLAAFCGFITPEEFLYTTKEIKAGRPVQFTRARLCYLDGTPADARLVKTDKGVQFRIRSERNVAWIPAAENAAWLRKHGFQLLPEAVEMRAAK